MKQNRQHIDSYCNHYPYFRKIHDKVVSVGHFGSGFDLLLRDVLLAIADVLGDGGGEQNGFLADHPYLLSQPFCVQGLDVPTVQCDL